MFLKDKEKNKGTATIRWDGVFNKIKLHIKDVWFDISYQIAISFPLF